MTIAIYNLKVEIGANYLQNNLGNNAGNKGDMQDRMIQSSVAQKKINRQKLQEMIE